MSRQEPCPLCGANPQTKADGTMYAHKRPAGFHTGGRCGGGGRQRKAIIAAQTAAHDAEAARDKRRGL